MTAMYADDVSILATASSLSQAQKSLQKVVRSLSFRPHIEETVRKAERKMSLIRTVADTSWGWRKKYFKRSEQHTSVVSLTTLLVNGVPGSATAS